MLTGVSGEGENKQKVQGLQGIGLKRRDTSPDAFAFLKKRHATRKLRMDKLWGQHFLLMLPQKQKHSNIWS